MNIVTLPWNDLLSRLKKICKKILALEWETMLLPAKARKSAEKKM
ncbi:hypothetical protein QIA36_05250 (plasmid) [Borreliella yangtzensis]